MDANKSSEKNQSTQAQGFCVIRIRKYYGPEETKSLVCQVNAYTRIGKVVFATRAEAQAAIDHEIELGCLAYGSYMCAHNESGSPDYKILSANHPTAKKLLAIEV